jgi:hypothetical protein
MTKILLAIVDAFKDWRHLLKGIQDVIIVYLDHKNFQYFVMVCVLNWHESWWALSFFQFWIFHHLLS